MAKPPPEPLATDLGTDPSALRVSRLRSCLAGATLAMVAISWPLWVDLADFPAVPFVRWAPSLPRAWSWLGPLALVASLGLGLTQRFGRAGMAASVPIFAALILGDQLRLQPWVYQYLVIASLLVLLPALHSMMFCRLFLVSIYFHSGLSKLDTAFAQEMGPLFLTTLARTLGVNASRMSDGMSLLMPMGEIVVALLLLFRRTRVLGFLGALSIHSVLLLILGPWGLGHSTIVLVWNMALVVEEYFLFWPYRGRPIGPMIWTPMTKLAGLAIGLLCLLPFGERSGLFDSWPSHALYASHCERSRIEATTAVPDALAPFANRVPGSTRWVLDFTRWCREVRGVPPYPQRRYANGVAEWLAGRVIENESRDEVTRVSHWRRADLLNGERAASSFSGRDEIRDEGGRFWFNAHPRDAGKRSDRVPSQGH